MNRIALEGTETKESVIACVQTSVGDFDKVVSYSELEMILENFEKVQNNFNQYGFSADFE